MELSHRTRSQGQLLQDRRTSHLKTQQRRSRAHVFSRKVTLKETHDLTQWWGPEKLRIALKKQALRNHPREDQDSKAAVDGLQDLGELPTELEWFSWMDHVAREACKLERKKKDAQIRGRG